MSFSQKSVIIAHESAVFQDAKKRMPYVPRREGPFHAVGRSCGIECPVVYFASLMELCLAADASAQIVRTAYFSIMVRVPPMLPMTTFILCTSLHSLFAAHILVKPSLESP